MHFGKLLLSHLVVEKQQSPGGKCMLLSQFTAPKKVRGPETAVGGQSLSDEIVNDKRFH